MRYLYKRIIAGFFVAVTLFFSCIPPACASNVVEILTSLPGDFFSWCERTSNTFGNFYKSLIDKDVCGSSPNTNGRHNFVEHRTQVDGKTGLFYICEYCGKSAGEVGKEAYDNQVAELPATGITSAGQLIWQPTVKDIVFPFTFRGLLSESASVNVLPWSHVAGMVEAVLGKLLDALTALSEMLMGKVKDVVEVVLSIFDELPQLFGGFLDFLGIVFPFLPSEITLLLTFGVIAVVFIGIIKAIRR